MVFCWKFGKIIIEFHWKRKEKKKKKDSGNVVDVTVNNRLMPNRIRWFCSRIAGYILPRTRQSSNGLVGFWGIQGCAGRMPANSPLQELNAWKSERRGEWEWKRSYEREERVMGKEWKRGKSEEWEWVLIKLKQSCEKKWF